MAMTVLDQTTYRVRTVPDDEGTALLAAGWILAPGGSGGGGGVTDAAVADKVANGTATKAVLDAGYTAILPVVTTVTASTTAALNTSIPVDATGGAITVTLPSPTRIGQRIRIEKVDTSANAVSVALTLKGNAATISMPFTAEIRTFVAESLTSWRTDSGNTPKTALDAAYAQTHTPFHGVPLTSYGHSFGQVQSTPNTRGGSLYPVRLRDRLRVDATLYSNRTVNGSRMTAIAQRAADTWVDGRGGLVTLLGNQNSAGNKEAVADFKAAVRNFLGTMLGSTGYPPTVLVIKDTTCTAVGYARYSSYGDADVAAYNGYLMDVVAEFPAGWIVVADPITDGWNPATMTAADGQHPNERGDAHIAASCLKALSTATFRPGLNVGVAGAQIITAPTAMTLTATPGDSQVVVARSGGAGAGVTYALYRGTTATGTPIASGASIFPFTDTGRTNGTAVSYVATATNTAGSVTSNVVSATPVAAGGGGSGTVLASDDFERADATTLGTTSVGNKTWTYGTAGSYGIASGKAYRSGGGTGEGIYATFDAGAADVDLTLTVSTPASGTGGCGPIFRASDASNLFTVDCTTAASSTKLYKRVGGAYTSLADLGVLIAAGDVIRVRAVGSAITVSVNGVQRASVTETFSQTATSVGIRIAAGTTAFTTPRLDNISVAVP